LRWFASGALRKAPGNVPCERSRRPRAERRSGGDQQDLFRSLKRSLSGSARRAERRRARVPNALRKRLSIREGCYHGGWHEEVKQVFGARLGGCWSRERPSALPATQSVKLIVRSLVDQRPRVVTGSSRRSSSYRRCRNLVAAFVRRISPVDLRHKQRSVDSI